MTTEDAAQPEVPAAAAAQQPAAYAPAGQNPYPAQNPYQAQNPYAAPYAAAAPRGLSIASMVCGITGLVLSFFLMGFLPALAGVILGHLGMKKEPTAKAFSITGLITGYAGIALALVVGLFTLAAILLPLWFVGSLGTAGYLNS